jgi:hypothetical protein
VASRGDSIRIHKKAIDRCNKETYHRYQTYVSEINTFERLNQEEETREKIERDPQNRQDPFFEFEDKRANAVKPELERYLEEPLIPCDLKTSHLDRVEILVKQASSSLLSLQSLEIFFQYQPLRQQLSVF